MMIAILICRSLFYPPHHHHHHEDPLMATNNVGKTCFRIVTVLRAFRCRLSSHLIFSTTLYHYLESTQNWHLNATHTTHVMFTCSSPSEALQTLHKMILRVGKDGRLSDGRFIMNTRVLDQLCDESGKNAPPKILLKWNYEDITYCTTTLVALPYLFSSYRV